MTMATRFFLMLSANIAAVPEHSDIDFMLQSETGKTSIGHARPEVKSNSNLLSESRLNKNFLHLVIMYSELYIFGKQGFEISRQCFCVARLF